MTIFIFHSQLYFTSRLKAQTSTKSNPCGSTSPRYPTRFSRRINKNPTALKAEIRSTHLYTSADHPGSCERRIPPCTRRAAAEATAAAGSPLASGSADSRRPAAPRRSDRRGDSLQAAGQRAGQRGRADGVT